MLVEFVLGSAEPSETTFLLIYLVLVFIVFFFLVGEECKFITIFNLLIKIFKCIINEPQNLYKCCTQSCLLSS